MTSANDEDDVTELEEEEFKGIVHSKYKIHLLLILMSTKSWPGLFGVRAGAKEAVHKSFKNTLKNTTESLHTAHPYWPRCPEAI